MNFKDTGDSAHGIRASGAFKIFQYFPMLMTFCTCSDHRCEFETGMDTLHPIGETSGSLKQMNF
jgi:hypothetical protein